VQLGISLPYGGTLIMVAEKGTPRRFEGAAAIPGAD
jgi:hypothetical protein